MTIFNPYNPYPTLGGFITPRTYNIFISHSWTYHDEYKRFENLLKQAPNFNFINHSVPKDDPIHNANNTAELRVAISREVQKSEVVIVLAGVYSTYSKWINIELDIASGERLFETKKPVLAVEPYGSERTSSVVKERANLIVGWSSQSIVDAIKKLAS